MIHASGIGTVLQNLIPVLKNKFNIILLGNPSELNKFDWSQNIEIVSFKSPVYSIKEQLKLPFIVPYCDIFLSPHFNVPVFPIKAKQRAVIIHDLYHMASTTLNLLHRIYAKILLTAAVKRSDKIITVSNFTLSELRKYFNLGNKIVHKISLGVDQSKFNNLPITDELESEVRVKYNLPPQFILYVGNVKPHKNLIGLVKALPLVAGNIRLPLVIVGKKEGFLNADEQLFRFIEQHCLSDHIHFTGFVDDKHLPAVYKLAKVFIFPSLYEGYGLPPLEAMASGCPTIVSNAASIPEVCKDASLYVDATQPKQLAEAIEFVIENNDLRLDLTVKGEELIESYSWTKSGNMLNSILQS